MNGNVLRTLMLIGGACCGPAAAMEPSGSVDVYYAPDAKLKVKPSVGGDIASDGGTAAGIAARAFVSERVFVDGEYQATRYEGFAGDNEPVSASWQRMGVGIEAPFGAYLLGQLVQLELENFSGGADHPKLGLQLGYHTPPARAWELRGQVGFQDVGDYGDGYELLVGGAFELLAPLRFFADYRVTTLKDDSGGKGQFFDVRTGLRWRF